MAIFKRKAVEQEVKSCNPADIFIPIHDLLGRGPAEHSKAYETNSYIRKAVDIRASSVSAPDLILLDMDGNAVEDRNHPLRILLEHPNRQQDWHGLMYQIESELALHGIAYVYIENSNGRIKSLRVIPAERVTPQPSSDWLNPTAYYDLNLGTNRRVLPSDMIAICRRYKEDNITPFSPVDACADAIETQRQAREWNVSLLANSGCPSMAVMVPDKLTQEQFTSFSGRLRANFTGSKKAGSTMVLDGGKSVQMYGMSAVDLDYNAGLTQTAKEIAIAMSVPPELLGDSANKTYSNAQEASREFALNLIIPELKLITSMLTARLCPTYDGISIGYDNEAVEGMTDDKTALMSALTSADYLTTNEKRAYLGFGSVENGDTVMMTAGKLPMEDIFLDTDETQPDDGDNYLMDEDV